MVKLGLRRQHFDGPWGRPDMAIFKFAEAISSNQPIPIYNHGDMSRDFTYIDDILEAVARLIKRIPAAGPSWSSHAPDPATSAAVSRVQHRQQSPGVAAATARNSRRLYRP
jgi:UDP-glucuronate 4-epimerase